MIEWYYFDFLSFSLICFVFLIYLLGRRTHSLNTKRLALLTSPYFRSLSLLYLQTTHSRQPCLNYMNASLKKSRRKSGIWYIPHSQAIISKPAPQVHDAFLSLSIFLSSFLMDKAFSAEPDRPSHHCGNIKKRALNS